MVEGAKASNNEPPRVAQTLIREGMTGPDESVKRMDKTHKPHIVVSYTDNEGRQAFTAPQPGILKAVVQGHEVWEERAIIPRDATPRIAGHSHKEGSSSFSPSDKLLGATTPVMKNRDGGGYHGQYDMYYKGWRFYLNESGQIKGSPFRY
jgi:hypothetical protein